MARIRTIKPEFWTDEQVADCSTTARLLFIGLWSFCDDGGNHPASTKTLKMEIFPGDDFSSETISEMIRELIRAELVVEYESEGKRYWHVTGWHHQKIEKPNKRHPSPEQGSIIQPFDDHSTTGPQPFDDHSTPESSLKESSLKESSLKELLLPLTEKPPIADSVPEKATKMTMIDFRFLHNQMFGFPMPGGCNKLATDLCHRFTAEQIRNAFERISAQHHSKHAMTYVKTALLNVGKPELAAVNQQTAEVFDYPSPEKQAILRRHLELRAKEAAEEEARYAAQS